MTPTLRMAATTERDYFFAFLDRGAGEALLLGLDVSAASVFTMSIDRFTPPSLLALGPVGPFASRTARGSASPIGGASAASQSWNGFATKYPSAENHLVKGAEMSRVCHALVGFDESRYRTVSLYVGMCFVTLEEMDTWHVLSAYRYPGLLSPVFLAIPASHSFSRQTPSPFPPPKSNTSTYYSTQNTRSPPTAYSLSSLPSRACSRNRMLLRR